jgi:hypothetical protein
MIVLQVAEQLAIISLVQSTNVFPMLIFALFCAPPNRPFLYLGRELLLKCGLVPA